MLPVRVPAHGLTVRPDEVDRRWLNAALLQQRIGALREHLAKLVVGLRVSVAVRQP